MALVNRKTLIYVTGPFEVVEINHPLVLILSKDGRRWFDNLTMSGGRMTLRRASSTSVPEQLPMSDAD